MVSKKVEKWVLWMAVMMVDLKVQMRAGKMVVRMVETWVVR